MPGYDLWKTRSPDDGEYDPALDDVEPEEEEVHCPICGKPAQEVKEYVWACMACDVEIETDVEVED